MASESAFEATMAMDHELCCPNYCRLAEYLEHALIAIKSRLEVATPGHPGYEHAMDQYMALAQLLSNDDDDARWLACMQEREKYYVTKYFVDILMDHGQDMPDVVEVSLEISIVVRKLDNPGAIARDVYDNLMFFYDWQQLPESDLEDVPTPGDLKCLHKAIPDSIPPDSECVICREFLTPNTVSDDEKVVELSTCHHHFHRECITTWLQAKNTCPICRAKVKMTSYETPEEMGDN